ncbi:MULTISPECIES: S8 family serine peptidase [unclassified Leptolyngbya]|uniref:S8 family serine peptidase n=1 Tax=unclassified Leptolyngbya TaxID=2650499 RepID=UPI0016839FA5|nr:MULTISPECIES: S8 family serine peptidase [unclassified Leptolyngbya]MBD1909112.1 S8 family serine peptidase [Leptolyngbya sp. FACHB-8]MBD2157485.1 S8 family serine peptidase [Leptolyngbya sp. FACHB-16]
MTHEFLPNDPLFNQQWYLHNDGQSGGIPGIDLNILPVWADYTGAGVRVAVIDDGVDYNHPDLIANYDFFSDLDAEYRVSDGSPARASDNHGTAVAGIIAASGNNGEGGVGIAPDANIAGLRIRYGDDPYFYENTSYALAQMANFDVANNSWGTSAPFTADFLIQPLYRYALEYAATAGRNGLGTAIVFSGGNEREIGMNTNYSNFNNSRFTIAVAALTHTGVYTAYSNPGASLLVSAFGGEPERGGTDGIVTTDRPGFPGYTSGNYTGTFNGTSSAAPMVTGIIALMLEANPNLGYRDIQEILAYSARQTDTSNPTWQTNGAYNWNGGGLRTSTDYGFGLVDAHAAVRLAETWQTQHTAANEWFVEGTQFLDSFILDQIDAHSQITLSTNLTVDHVEIDVNLSHQNLGDVQLILVSPNGTESVLMDRPGASANSPFGMEGGTLQFTFMSTQFWGEDAAGTWTLVVRDRATGDQGILDDWSLRAYGDLPTLDNTYIYTNSFSELTIPNRGYLYDAFGFDTVNAAAIASNLTINLNPGSTSVIDGRLLTITATTVIEAAIGGDGHDEINGNFASNSLFGARGDDALQGFGGDDWIAGGQGNDWLDGGFGNDTLTGGNGQNSFYFGSQPGIDLITDFVSGVDSIVLDSNVFIPIFGDISLTFDLAVNDFNAGLSAASLVYSLSTGNLFYNANGSQSTFGNGGQFAILAGTPALSAEDFVVV